MSRKHDRKDKEKLRIGGWIEILTIAVVCMVFFVLLMKYFPDRVLTYDRGRSMDILMQRDDAADRRAADALRSGDLVLVSNAVEWTFETERELVSVYDNMSEGYDVGGTDIMVAAEMMPHLDAMLSDFYWATALDTVNVISGYRTLDDQQALYNDAVVESGEEHAARYVAVPGGSEHHTGLAVDLGLYYADAGVSETFTGEGQYAWIEEHAWEYGFIRRYTAEKEYLTGIAEETWHFRYVGVPHAWYMQENNLCLEEYLELLKDYPVDGTHLMVDCQETEYEIYYCAGMEPELPRRGDYTISGNNVDGFIVTVTH